MKSLEALLSKKILVLDGAMGTMVQGYNLKEKDFDLVFTSPPFFKLESYTNNKKQSNKNYSTLKEWFENFLIISVKKACNVIIEGGHMALYISDYTNVKYVQDLKLNERLHLESFHLMQILQNNHHYYMQPLHS